MVHRMMIELLVVLHVNLLVLKLLNVIEDCIDDVIDFRKSSCTTALRQERLRDRWQLIVSKELHFLNLLVRYWMQELPRVHFGTEEERFMKIPSTSDACQEIIANSRANFSQSVGIKW